MARLLCRPVRHASSGMAAGASRSPDARSLLRPLVRLVHPDLLVDAPASHKAANAKSLAALHALIDTIDERRGKGLAPRYDFTFYARGGGGGGNGWREFSRTVTFPPDLVREAAAQAVGTRLSAALQVHVDRQLRGLMRAALGSDGPQEEEDETQIEDEGERRQGAGGLRSSSLNRARAAAAAADEEDCGGGRRRHAARPSGPGGDDNPGGSHRFLQSFEANAAAVSEFVDFLYGSGTSCDVQLQWDEAGAAWHVAALLRTGRVLVSDTLDPATSVMALRKLGIALLTYHRALDLDDPAYSRVMILLHEGDTFDPPPVRRDVDGQVRRVMSHAPSHMHRRRTNARPTRTQPTFNRRRASKRPLACHSQRQCRRCLLSRPPRRRRLSSCASQ